MTATEWACYVENDRTVRHYFCKECKIFHANMLTRRVTEDAGTHKEFKVVCNHCGKSSSLHWSKNLAEFSWKAMNPNWDDDYISEDLTKRKEGGKCGEAATSK